MSIRVMTRVWDEAPYEGTRLLILLALADCAHEDGSLFISQPLLAAKARCSVEYVRKSVQQFVADGVVEVTKKGSSRGRATEYRLLSPYTVGGSSMQEPPNVVGVQPPNSDQQPPNSDQQPPNSAPNHPSYTSVLPIRPEDPDALLLLSDDDQPWPKRTDAPRSREQEFASFWLAYPRKAGKRAALQAWDRAMRRADAQAVIAGAVRYANDPNRDDAFTAHPATWLNQDRWEDDALPERSTGSRRPSGTSLYLDAANALDGWADQQTRAIGS